MEDCLQQKHNSTVLKNDSKYTGTFLGCADTHPLSTNPLTTHCEGKLVELPGMDWF